MEYKFTEDEIRAIASASEESRKMMEEKYPDVFKPKFNPEEFLRSFFNDYVSKTDRKEYPNLRFIGFNKSGNYLFDYDEKNNKFWLSYKIIWSVLEKEMRWNYSQTQAFCSGIVEDHFKLKDVTTCCCPRRIRGSVEDHFKLKDVTTETTK